MVENPRSGKKLDDGEVGSSKKVVGSVGAESVSEDVEFDKAVVVDGSAILNGS
ncbi:MAG: hypothetical protein ACTSWW_00915 [Promethearchaeota archaeon]